MSARRAAASSATRQFSAQTGRPNLHFERDLALVAGDLVGTDTPVMIDIKFVENGLKIGTKLGRIVLFVMIGISSSEPRSKRVGIAGRSAKRLSRWYDEYLAPRWAELVACG